MKQLEITNPANVKSLLRTSSLECNFVRYIIVLTYMKVEIYLN